MKLGWFLRSYLAGLALILVTVGCTQHRGRVVLAEPAETPKIIPIASDDDAYFAVVILLTGQHGEIIGHYEEFTGSLDECHIRVAHILAGNHVQRHDRTHWFCINMTPLSDGSFIRPKQPATL